MKPIIIMLDFKTKKQQLKIKTMNSYNKVMMHDREIISDAEKQIHRVDHAKKYGK